MMVVYGLLVEILMDNYNHEINKIASNIQDDLAYEVRGLRTSYENITDIIKEEIDYN